MDTPATLAAVVGLILAPILGALVVQSPQMIVIALVAGVFESALIARLHWGVYLVAFGAFFDSIYLPAGFAALGIGDFAAFAMLPAWLLHRLLRPSEARLPGYWGIILLFLALTAVSLMLGVKPSIAYGAYSRIVVYAFVLFALVDTMRDRQILINCAWIMAACGTFHAIFAISGVGGAARAGGLVDQPNLLGGMLSFGAIPAAGLLAREARNYMRILLALALAAMLIAVIMTISRGTYISLSIAFLWWMRRYRRMAIVGITVAGLISFYVSRAAQTQRVEYIGRRLEMNDSSVRGRWQVVKNALTVISHRPLFGVGFNQFVEMQRAVEINREQHRGSHNFYLGVAAASGIPAMLCLFGFAFLQGRRMWRTRARLDAEGDVEGAWLVGIFQALIIYHSLSVIVRGGTRITEWYMLATYCAASFVVAKQTLSTTRSPSDSLPNQHRRLVEAA